MGTWKSKGPSELCSDVRPPPESGFPEALKGGVDVQVSKQGVLHQFSCSEGT